MRILHVTQPTELGLRVVADLVEAQVAQGAEVAVASPTTGPMAAWVHAAGGRHHPWPAVREPHRAVGREIAALGKVVKQVQPDVVHLHCSKAGLVGRLVLRGRIPTLFQPHAWSFLSAGPRSRQLAVGWERAGSRWVDALVCCSTVERERGLAAGITAPAYVVPNAVDLDAFGFADGAAKLAARRRLGLDNGPLAVCVGRLSHQKGQDLLLHAWPAVERAVPGARLVLVGEGPYEEQLRAVTTSTVSLVGRRHDVADWMAAADIIAMPSRYEGMALSLLEALAVGRPVVATDVDGMAEVLGTDGRCGGLIVPIEDPSSLAAGIIELLADPGRAEALGGSGRQTVEASHSLGTWSERMDAVYEAVLAGRRPQARPASTAN